MAETSRRHPLAIKVTRVALVFLLVFWASFRVEYLAAYAAVVADDAAGHADNSLTELVVYELDRSDPQKLGNPVRSASNTAKGSSPAAIRLSAEGEQLRFVAVPDFDDSASNAPKPDDVLIASFVEWKTEGDPCVTASTDAAGVLTLTATANGTATVVCALKEGHERLLSDSFATEHPGKPFEVSFQVNVELPADQVAPDVIPFQLVDAQGNVLSGDETLVLTDSERSDYAFQARLSALDGVTREPIFEYTSTQGSLAAFSGGLLTDLAWELAEADEEVATISPDGVLHMVDDGAVTVVCSTHYAASADGSPSWSTSVRVESGVSGGNPQGASHPQDTVRIVANLGPVGAGDSPQDGSSAPENPNSQDSAAPEEASDPADSHATDGDEATGEADAIIDREYTLADLEQKFSQTTDMFAMRGTDGVATITATGFLLADLLADAGIDTDALPIESLDFIDYRGITTTVSWGNLKPSSTGQGPLLATKSYVHGEEDGSDPVSEDKLLDNTRFRLLSSSPLGVEPSALRWINTIQVNLEGSSVDPDSKLAVSVSYVPVPLGVTAVFVAVPSHTINGRWDCTWQQSSDGGLTWTDVENGEVQTLRVMTTRELVEAHTLYRVVLDTNIRDDQTGEYLTATSKPVMIEVGDGFSVVLAYDPPLAGDIALFQSSVLGFDGDASKIEYVWEWSEDGGVSWQVIAGRSGPSLSIPTEPISEDDLEEDVSSSDESASNLMYIRVRAIAPDGRVAVSNAQPLTVHVGDSGSSDGGGDVPDLPSDPSNGAAADTPSTSGGSTVQPSRQPTVTQVSSIAIEQPTSSPAAVAPVSDSVQLYINEEVSAVVAEQQQAVAEYITSTTPGARWTSLSTVQPTGDDVGAILAGNPFAPFVVPLSVGAVAAGGVEKLLAFRRQVS